MFSWIGNTPTRPVTVGPTHAIASFLFFVALLGWHMPAQAGAGLTGFSVDPGPPPKKPPSAPLPLSTRQPLVIPAGSELCGIDDIFNSGLEIATFATIAQIPGGIASPGLAQDITGPALTLSLTTSGSTTDASVDVTGTFTGPVNTGITVNSAVGYVGGGKFLVPNVPLVSGSNPLSVAATTMPGATMTASGSISQSGPLTPIVVAVDRPVGFAPFAENFAYIVGALPGGATLTTLAIDFRGVGTNDYSSTFAGAPKTYTYQQPGLYKAKFLFTDSNNATYTIYRFVLIQDFVVQRGMMCDIYGYLKDRLNAQDANGAANLFQPAERSTYFSFFAGMGSNMPTMATQLGFVVEGVFGNDSADLLLSRDNTTSQTRAGYPLRITQSGDGVWRISEM